MPIDEEYGYPSRMNYNASGSVTTSPIRTGHRAFQYIYGSPDENILKTKQLKTLGEMDPAMSDEIERYTNEMVAKAANTPSWRPEKDLYALGQDAYLLEMGRRGYLSGIRGAHQTARR